MKFFSLRIDYPPCFMLSKLYFTRFCVTKVGLKQIFGHAHYNEPITLRHSIYEFLSYTILELGRAVFSGIPSHPCPPLHCVLTVLCLALR